MADSVDTLGGFEFYHVCVKTGLGGWTNNIFRLINKPIPSVQDQILNSLTAWSNYTIILLKAYFVKAWYIFDCKYVWDASVIVRCSASWLCCL